MIKEVSMYDFEIRMRKLISDILQPSIEKMAREKDAGATLVRTAEDLVKRMSKIEEAVYNQGRADPIFD
jgi:cystathionine beta-lyase/cystathionine gamma-synthase